MRSQSLLSLVWLLPLAVLILFWKPAPGKQQRQLSSGEERAAPALPKGPLCPPNALPPADPTRLMEQYQEMGPMFTLDGWVYLANDRAAERLQFRRLHPEFPVGRDDPQHLAQWRHFYHASEWGEWDRPSWFKRSVTASLAQAFAHPPICRRHRCMVELRLGNDAVDPWRLQLLPQLSSGVSAEFKGGTDHPLLVLTLNPGH
ncbi:hypothetical protein FCL40_01895 [Ferrimonas sediminicola]|uniref:Uncharacterized protein n=1 Tax=Ferrimonas sediminicola TaxID=2569538 RepID=A0A4U1BIZ8_9GAMM|nr:hypothetical protein [Ferrimonas sediminicola]TKB51333.1 hypothetical protein FCL40_01895 [Ferrimonas sediminicola]